MATALLHNFALMHREQDFNEDNENEDVPFDVVHRQQTPVEMPNASSLFHDTLLNKINGLIKIHVRFIEKKIGNKKNIHRN